MSTNERSFDVIDALVDVQRASDTQPPQTYLDLYVYQETTESATATDTPTVTDSIRPYQWGTAKWGFATW